MSAEKQRGERRRQHKYLLKPDIRKPDEKGFPDYLKVARIPRDTDYRPKMPPVWDQGNLGACQSYAADAIDQYVKGYAYTPSHIFTYYNVRRVEGEPAGEDTGGTLSGTCQAVKKYGICSSAVWPNDNSRFAEEPSAAAYADGAAGNDGLAEFYRAESVDEARQALAAGNLPYVGIRVYENLETGEVMQSGVIPAPKGELLGGHALVIVGHHDNFVKRCIFSRESKGYFLLRNSWGTGVGLNGTGYFKVPYEVFGKLLMDMWIIVK